MPRTHDKNLIDAVQHTAFENRNGLFVPRTEGDVRTNFPQCLTCRREVEAVEIKNLNGHACELWARCHGKEDWFSVRFPGRIDMEDDDSVADHMRGVVRSASFFNPSDVL